MSRQMGASGSRMAGLVFGAAVASFALVAPVSATMTIGEIKSFECGDNCYLTVAIDGEEDLVGLCAAEACQPWNEEVAMPDEMIGKRVQVVVEMGQQTDNEGNLMGEFPAFTEIAFIAD